MGYNIRKKTLIMKPTALVLFVFTVVGLVSEADSVTNSTTKCETVLKKLDLWTMMEAQEMAIQVLVRLVHDVAGKKRHLAFEYLSGQGDSTGHINPKDGFSHDLWNHLYGTMKIESSYDMLTMKKMIRRIKKE